MDELFARLKAQALSGTAEEHLHIQISYSGMEARSAEQARDCIACSQEARANGDYEVAIAYALDAIEWALRGHRDDDLFVADMYNSASITYRWAGMYDEAIACAARSRDIARRHGEDTERAKSLNTLGAAYSESGDDKRAALAFCEGLEYASEAPIRAVLAENLRRVRFR